MRFVNAPVRFVKALTWASASHKRVRRAAMTWLKSA